MPSTGSHFRVSGPRDLHRLLEARSVAVVGASERSGSFGRRMMTELRAGGFDGPVYPVNPRYDEVLGRRCLPSLAELPGPVDLVLLGVPNAVLEDQLAAAAALGCGAAVVFASGHLDDDRDPPLAERLRRIAVTAGMELCGCNCMGFVNVEARLRACGFYEPADLRPGGIALFCHSGSVFSAMLHNRRGLRFNVVVSVGTELVTGLPDYMHHALGLDSTRIVALFIETVRDPRGFESALEASAEAGVPVVALKVGTVERSRAMVAAHTGALAGDDGALEAVFDAYGVTRVRSLDEMADTLELLCMQRSPRGGAVASIHDSGGERAMFVDVAEQVGVALAEVSDDTKRRLARVLEPGLEPDNPLDAWGTGNASDLIFREAMEILLDDDATALLVFCADLTAEDDPSMAYIDIILDVHERAVKPVVVVANLTSGIDPAGAARLRAAGVPVLEGTVTALQALRHLMQRRDREIRRRRSVPWVAAVAPPARPPARAPRGQAEALELLRAYGIPVVDSLVADDAGAVLEAAARVGFPVALKAEQGSPHKTDAGGVYLGLGDRRSLLRSYEDIAARLGPRVLIQPMVSGLLELAFGLVVDASFGPVVMVGAGGILIEGLGDRAFVKPPIDPERAGEVVGRLRVVRALCRRVRPPRLEDVALALSRFSHLAVDLAPHVVALDVNPVMVTREGCVAVDAFAIGRER